MSASAQIPQFTLERDADLQALTTLRARHENDQGAKLSYSDVFISAVAKTLAAHPALNASFDDDAIIEHADVNVAFAVALDDGLIAPAIANANALSLAAVASERERLTKAAREGSLRPEEILSATFTISNLGPLAVRRFRALVVPPQAAILAIGAPTSDGRVSCSLSCDHRVVDGAPAAKFLGDFVALIEKPDWLAIEENEFGIPDHAGDRDV